MSASSKSFLATGEFHLGPVRWHDDEFGPYWNATFFRKHDGLQQGIVGTFYDISSGEGADGSIEASRRPTRREQEEELRSWGFHPEHGSFPRGSVEQQALDALADAARELPWHEMVVLLFLQLQQTTKELREAKGLTPPVEVHLPEAFDVGFAWHSWMARGGGWLAGVAPTLLGLRVVRDGTPTAQLRIE